MSDDGSTWPDVPCSVETVYARDYPDPCEAHREVRAIIIRPMWNWIFAGSAVAKKEPERGDEDG